MLLHLVVLAVQAAGHYGLQVVGADCGGLQRVYVCHPHDPTLFDICIGDRKHTMTCPKGLHFNRATQVCDWPENANCGHAGQAGHQGHPRHLSSPRSHASPVHRQPVTRDRPSSSGTQDRSDQRHENSVTSNHGDSRPVGVKRFSSGGISGRTRYSKNGRSTSTRPPVFRNRHTVNNSRRNPFEEYGKKFRESKAAVGENGNNAMRSWSRWRKQAQRPQHSNVRRKLLPGNRYLHSSAQSHSRQGEFPKQNKENKYRTYKQVQDGYSHQNTTGGHKDKSHRSEQRQGFRNNSYSSHDSPNQQHTAHNQRWSQKINAAKHQQKYDATNSNANSPKDGFVSGKGRNSNQRSLYGNSGKQYVGEGTARKEGVFKNGVNERGPQRDDNTGLVAHTARSPGPVLRPWWTSRSTSAVSRSGPFLSSPASRPRPQSPAGEKQQSHPSESTSRHLRPGPEATPSRNGLQRHTERELRRDSPGPESQSSSQDVAGSRRPGSVSHTGHTLSAPRDSGSPRRPRLNSLNKSRSQRAHLRGQDSSKRFNLYGFDRHAGLNDPGRRRGQNDQGRRRFRPKGISLGLNPAPGSQPHSAAKPISAAAAVEKNVWHQRPKSATKSTTATAAHKRRKKTRKLGKCSPKTCLLPDCRCVGTDIPGGLTPEETPQVIMLTFDDSVNAANIDYYRRIFGSGRFRNPNGCPIQGTFYVSGDATKYDLVERLYKQGQEIASHSVSHRSPSTYWATAGYDGYVEEIEGMRKRLSSRSHVAHSDIRGMRAPFLQLGGDDQYSVLEDFRFLYDSSMVTGHLYRNDAPPVWPFTLDYPPDSGICSLPPCPTASYPGLWEVPLVRWYGSNRLACAMPDGCTTDPGKEGTLRFLKDNFFRHYQTNRAPLGIFLHASWFRRKEGNLEGLMEFLDTVTRSKDVWVLPVTRVVDWIQNPVPNSKAGSIPSWSCH